MSIEVPPIDFVRIFNQRLEDVKPVDEAIGRRIARTVSDVDIDLLRKRVPVIVFMIGKGNVFDYYESAKGLWMEPPDTLPKGHFTHNFITEKFDAFMKTFSLSGEKFSSGSLVVDGEDKRYLVLDSLGGVKAVEEREENPRGFLNIWTSIIEDYGIEALVLDWMTDSSNKEGGPIKILTSDMLWRERAGLIVGEIAQQHKMTASQFLRFWLLTVDDKERKQQGTWDKIAEQVTAYEP